MVFVSDEPERDHEPEGYTTIVMSPLNVADGIVWNSRRRICGIARNPGRGNGRLAGSPWRGMMGLQVLPEGE